MKIFFLNPPDENKVSENPDEQGDEYIESDDFGHFPPLGLLYVLSYLEENTKNHEFRAFRPKFVRGRARVKIFEKYGPSPL